MLKLKIERTHSQLYLKIIDEIRNSGPERRDLVFAGLITLSPPKLIERDERIFAIYGKREKTILSACYQILSQEVNKRLSENCIGGRKGFFKTQFYGFPEQGEGAKVKLGCHHRWEKFFRKYFARNPPENYQRKILDSAGCAEIAHGFAFFRRP
jgi:hypothetical protein